MKPDYYPERRLILKYLRGKIIDIGCNQGIFHKYVLEEKGKVLY